MGVNFDEISVGDILLLGRHKYSVKKKREDRRVDVLSLTSKKIYLGIYVGSFDEIEHMNIEFV